LFNTPFQGFWCHPQPCIVPARELLAQLLQIQSRSQDSFVDYETVLKTARNGFNALWGAALTAESAGNAGAAAKYFPKLVEVGVGTERPELDTARKKAGVVARNRNLQQLN
jgi:hypothetical protein